MKPRKWSDLQPNGSFLIYIIFAAISISSLLFAAHLIHEYDLPIEDYFDKIVVDKSLEIMVTVSAAIVAIGYTLDYFVADRMFNEYPSKFIEKYITRKKLTGPYKGLIAIIFISLLITLFNNHIGYTFGAVLTVTISFVFIYMIYWFTRIHTKLFAFMNVPKTIERVSTEVSDYVDKNNDEQFKIHMNELNDIILGCITNSKIEYSKVGIHNITKIIIEIIESEKIQLLNEYKFVDKLKELFIESLKIDETKISILIIDNVVKIGNLFIESNNVKLLNEYKFIDKLKEMFIESLKIYESKVALYVLDVMMKIMYKFIHHDISLLHDDEYMYKLKEMYIVSLKNDDSDISLNVIKNFTELINKVHNNVIANFPVQNESIISLPAKFDHNRIENAYYEKLENSYEKMFIASLQSEDNSIIADFIKSNIDIMEVLAGRNSINNYSKSDNFINFEYAVNSVSKQLFKLFTISINNNAILIFKLILENFHQHNFIHHFIGDIRYKYGHEYKFIRIGELLSDDILNDLNFKLEFDCTYNFKKMRDIYSTVNDLKQKINQDDKTELLSYLRYAKRSLMQSYFSNLVHALFFELGASLFDRRYMDYIYILWDLNSSYQSPIIWLTFYLFGGGNIKPHDNFKLSIDHSIYYRLNYYSLLTLHSGDVFSYTPLKHLEFRRSHKILKFLSNYDINQIQSSFNKTKNLPYINNLNNSENKIKSIDSALKLLHKQRLNYEIGIISKFNITNKLINRFTEYLKNNYINNWRIEHVANFKYKKLSNTSKFMITTEYNLPKEKLIDMSFHKNIEKYFFEYDSSDIFNSKHNDNELSKIYHMISSIADTIPVPRDVNIIEYLESIVKNLKYQGIYPNAIFLTDNVHFNLYNEKKLDNIKNLITIDNTPLSFVSTVFYLYNKTESIRPSITLKHMFNDIVIFDKSALQITYKTENINNRLKITHTNPNRSPKNLSIKFTVKSHMQVRILDPKKFIVLTGANMRTPHKLR